MRRAHRLAHALRRHARPAGSAIGLMLLLMIASWLLLPFVCRLWDFVLGGLLQLSGLSALRHDLAAAAGLPGEFGLQVPVLQRELVAPSCTEWLLNLGGATSLALAAGLMPALLRTPLRALCGFHACCVLLAGLAGGGDVGAHTRLLATLTLCLILAMPLLLALGHSIMERSNARRIAACALCSGYLVLALPFKLALHLALIDLLGTLALPTLFLLFGPAFDLLAILAIYAWLASWRQPSLTLPPRD